MLNHLNTLSPNDCVNWQLMKVWSMESSPPQNKQSLSCLIPKRNNSFLVTILCKNLNRNSFSLFSLKIFLADLKNVCHSFNSVLRVFFHFSGPVGSGVGFRSFKIQ